MFQRYLTSRLLNGVWHYTPSVKGAGISVLQLTSSKPQYCGTVTDKLPSKLAFGWLMLNFFAVWKCVELTFVIQPFMETC